MSPRTLANAPQKYKCNQMFLICINIRGGMVHVFVSNRRSTDLSARCMRPYDEYRQFIPNPEGGAHSNATLFDNRQQTNSKSHECTLENKPPRHHVLILNASLTWTDKSLRSNKHSTFCEMELCARVSDLSHSAQIQIFHHISMFAM